MQKHWKWPRRLYLVRHGQSAGNVARNLAEQQGLRRIGIEERDMDVPLSDLGATQAKALGRWFDSQPSNQRPFRILTSPYVRARETARIARAEFKNQTDEIEFIVDERIREREFGLITGFTRAGIEHAFPLEAKSYGHLKKFYYRPPGGESWCDVILRLRSVLDSLSRDYAGETVMIVCHTVVVNCFRYLFDHLTEIEILKIDAENEIANCSITTYVSERGGEMTLESFNAVHHLLDHHTRVTEKPDLPHAPE